MESAAFGARSFMEYRPPHAPPLIECYTSRRFRTFRTNGAPNSEKSDNDPQALYEVRIIDNDVNTYQEVIEVCVAALGVTMEAAFSIAWAVDHNGSCVVAVCPSDTAESIAETIRTIGIETQVNPVAVPTVDRQWEDE